MYKSFVEQFEKMISELYISHDYLVCLGDFNIDILDTMSRETKCYISMLDEFGLHQIISEPTRITFGRTSLIDHILVTDINSIKESGTRDMSGFSDHELIYCKVNIEVDNPIRHPIIRRNFKNFSVVDFHTYLECIEWNSMFKLKSVDEKVAVFTNNVISAFDVFAPLVIKRTSKPKPPWLTDNILFMMSLRDDALKRYKRTKSNAHWEYYKSLRNLITLTIRNEKKAFLNTTFRNCARKDLWKELRNCRIYNNKNKAFSIPHHLNKPDEINDFFVDSVTVPDMPLHQNIVQTYQGTTRVPSKFHFKLVDESHIIKILNKSKSNSAGSDDLSTFMIKLCCPVLIPVILHIINTCLLESVFPQAWKIAKIKPLPKVSSPSGFKDLRPISILPALAKVLERVMSNQIQLYLIENSLLPQKQSGFRQGYSCNTALLNVTDDIFCASDRGDLTALVLLDFSKAFDTIKHSLLFRILNYLAFGESAIALLKSYLSNRNQYVEIDGIRSSCREINQGVPQGSVLGPLLFSIYTTKLLTVITHSNYHQYADDTQIYISFPYSNRDEACLHLNQDLNKLTAFASQHYLNVNGLKSKFLVFGTSSQSERLLQHFKVKVNNTEILPTNSARNLGLILDTKLRFTDHINNCTRQAYGKLKILYGHRQVLNRDIKIILSEALILSQFNFCDSLYDPCLDAVTTRKIQVCQNSCLRFIYGIKRRQHITHKIKETGWLNMQDRRYLHSAVLFHRIISTHTPSYLHNKINYRTDVHNLNLRNKGQISPPLLHTELCKRSFSYHIYKLYNELPLPLKTLPILEFKKQLKERLLGK